MLTPAKPLSAPCSAGKGEGYLEPHLKIGLSDRAQTRGLALEESFPLYTYMRIEGLPFYHGVKVRTEKPSLQALTLRIPEQDYQLLRALAFAEDRSINDLVLKSIRAVIDEQRPRLEEILARARDARTTYGQPADPPRNPQGKGRRPRTPRTPRT